MTPAEIRHQYLRWKHTDANIAQSQGWDMFDYDCRGLLQIQRCDEAEAFESDAEAIAFVKTRADSGSTTAALAIELHEFFDPLIYADRPTRRAELNGEDGSLDAARGPSA